MSSILSRNLHVFFGQEVPLFFNLSIFCLYFFAEISTKFSAVRWFDKTEDCIFPRSFILRSNVQSFNILPSFNLAIYLAVFSQSIAFHNLFKRPLLHLQNCFYLSTLFGSTHPLRVSEISSELILYITSPLYLYSLRLMQLNVCHILHS